MTLRTKTLLIIGLTLGALFAVLFVTLSAILTGGFAKVEEQFTARNVRRAEEVLSDEIAKVSRTVGDWAPWDDTYDFVQSDLSPEPFQDYIDNNLYEDIFSNLGLNLMLFFDSQNEPVHRQSFDLDEGAFVEDESTALSQSVLDHLKQNDLLLQHDGPDSSTAGLLLLPEYPVLVASHPIVKSDLSGYPDGGTLIMARYVDESLITSLETRTRLDMSIHRMDTGELPVDFQNAAAEMEAMQTDRPVFIEPLEGGCLQDGNPDTPVSDCIAGYTIVKDLYGTNALLVRVAIPRDVSAQGAVTQRILILSLLGVGFVFTVLTLIILERLVLARVARLSVGVDEIGASGNLSTRLQIEGQDELSGLAEDINKMLQDLQASLQREKELKTEIQQLRIEIDLVKQQKQVSEITETDFFADVQAKARQIRERKESSRTAKKDITVKEQQDTSALSNKDK